MANTKQARKRARQAVARNQHLSAQRTQYRTAVKSVRKAILAGDKVAATETFKKAQCLVVAMCSNGALLKFAASCHKCRLSAAIKAMA